LWQAAAHKLYTKRAGIGAGIAELDTLRILFAALIGTFSTALKAELEAFKDGLAGLIPICSCHNHYLFVVWSLEIGQPTA